MWRKVKPGTPPDFVLKVHIDNHPVKFFVHKRPHVDFFLSVVSLTMYNMCQCTVSAHCPGVPVVRAGRIHGQYRLLRQGGGGQAGQRPGGAPQAVLQVSCH